MFLRFVYLHCSSFLLARTFAMFVYRWELTSARRTHVFASLIVKSVSNTGGANTSLTISWIGSVLGIYSP